MRQTLILLLCIFSYTNAEVARISSEKYGGATCPNGLTGATCEMEGNPEPSSSFHQYTFLTILNYKTQMLPKDMVCADAAGNNANSGHTDKAACDGDASGCSGQCVWQHLKVRESSIIELADGTTGALTKVSDATGHRFIKTTTTLMEIGSQRYEACGVKYDTSDLANYAEFVPITEELSDPYKPSTDSSCPSGDKCHVLEMDQFLNGESVSSARFRDRGTCAGGSASTSTERSVCVGGGGAFTTTHYECEFYVQNNMYLGSVKLAIAFQKTSTTTATGDSRLTKLHASLKFVPSADDPNFYVSAEKAFIPEAQGFQNSHMRDLAISYADSCYSKASYLRNDKGATPDGCLDYTENHGIEANDDDDNTPIPSSSDAGTVKLRLTGIFLDPRYKIVSQSGVETLPAAIGNVLIIKEGLELHKDYRSFNDPSKDVRHNGGDNTVQMAPIAFRLRKRSNSNMQHCTTLEGTCGMCADNGKTNSKPSVTSQVACEALTGGCIDSTGAAVDCVWHAGYSDFSNAGQPLAGGDAPQLQQYHNSVSNMGATGLTKTTTTADYNCEVDSTISVDSDISVRGACHAQYVLTHEFEFSYGDLPHFKPGYIGCDICESVLAVKAFSEEILGTQKYQVNTRVAVSVPDLPAATNDITVATVNLVKKQAAFSFAPDVFYKMGELFDVEQSVDHFIDKTTTNKPKSLDAQLNFFNEKTAGGFLDFASFKPNGINAINAIGMPVGSSGNCPTLTELSLYQLATDTRVAVETLLISDCDIKVPKNFYGTKYEVKFHNTEASDGAEEVVEIRETDSRSIMIGSSQMNLINRVEAEILRVATTITMDITKTIGEQVCDANGGNCQEPTIPRGYANWDGDGIKLKTQTITFRLKGDKGDFAGFIGTTDGGRECAGDKIFWKSQTDRPYVLPYQLNAHCQGNPDIGDQTACDAINNCGENSDSACTWESTNSHSSYEAYCEDDTSLNKAACNAQTNCGIDTNEMCRWLNPAFGICVGAEGITPMETQPSAPVTSSSGLVTYDECKQNKGTWEITSVPDVTVTCTPVFECNDATKTTQEDCTGNTCTIGGAGGQACVWAEITLRSSHCALDKNSDKFGINLGCTEAAKQEEVLFRSSPFNGEVKEHTIRSTDQCTGKLDFQLEDQTQYQEFAIYKARIECSRVSTQELSDNVQLKYNYHTKLDLSDNSLIVTAEYTDTVDTAGKCDDDDDENTYTKATCTGTWTDEYSVSANFGVCGSDNEIIEADAACSSAVKFVADAAADSYKLELVMADDSAVTDGLEILQKCHDQGNAIQTTHTDISIPRGWDRAIDSDLIASYIITYDLAMQYERTPLQTAIWGSSKIKYCDDQQFVATIRRDAKATTTVAQIKAASLNRAVIVADIGWVGYDQNHPTDNTPGVSAVRASDCTNPNEYQLEVIMKSMDQDGRSVSASWQASQLTKAFIDTASDAQNSNRMYIHKPDTDGDGNGEGFGILDSSVTTVTPVENGGVGIDSLSDTDTGNFFKVRSHCVVITDCVADADGVIDGDSWGDLTSYFKTDLVIRGTFLRSDVDSKIELSLAFGECPLEAQAEVTGEVRVGLQLACNDDRAEPQEKILAKSLAQTTIDTHDKDLSTYATALEYTQATGVIDCSRGFADDVGRVTGFIFVTKSGCTDVQSNPNIDDGARGSGEDYDPDCALLQSAYQAAGDQGWTEDIVDVFIDRFDTSSDTPLLSSSTRICKCESGSGNACELDSTTIINLPAFVQRTDIVDNGEPFTPFQACGIHTTGEDTTTNVGNEKMKHQFGLMPMSSATSDLFQVRYEIVLVSSDLSTRRRLRSSYPLKLETNVGSDIAATNKFSVLDQMSDGSASQATQTNDYDPGLIVDGETQGELVAFSNETDGSHHEHSSDHHSHDISGGAIAGIVLGALSVIALLVLYFTRNNSGVQGTTQESAKLVEKDATVEALRNFRFENLRY